MEIKETDKGGAVVLEISGRLDAVTSQELQLRCDAIIARGNNKIIFDLGGLDYISSLGLRVFLSVGKKVKGGYIRFCRTRPSVKEVFDISGFSSIFSMFADLDSAVYA
jgi:anti-sigma B factor antagonist